ncbi:MAG: hypothetical protein IT232_11815 [Flavobacteriales bacterium]|nr:hypothetical protein [Flavobacteriales bacterium]
MKKIVAKYSKLPLDLKKLVKEKLENEEVKFFNFPYQGGLEEGFLLEGVKLDGEEVNYLVIVDIEKKSKFKPSDEDDEDDEIDELEGVSEGIPDVDADDEFKDDDVEESDDVDEFDDDDDDDDEPIDEGVDDDDDEK